MPSPGNANLTSINVFRRERGLRRYDWELLVRERGRLRLEARGRTFTESGASIKAGRAEHELLMRLGVRVECSACTGGVTAYLDGAGGAGETICDHCDGSGWVPVEDVSQKPST